MKQEGRNCHLKRISLTPCLPLPSIVLLEVPVEFVGRARLLLAYSQNLLCSCFDHHCPSRPPVSSTADLREILNRPAGQRILFPPFLEAIRTYSWPSDASRKMGAEAIDPAEQPPEERRGRGAAPPAADLARETCCSAVPGMV